APIRPDVPEEHEADAYLGSCHLFDYKIPSECAAMQVGEGGSRDPSGRVVLPSVFRLSWPPFDRPATVADRKQVGVVVPIPLEGPSVCFRQGCGFQEGRLATRCFAHPDTPGDAFPLTNRRTARRLARRVSPYHGSKQS